MAITAKSLADGQLAATKTTIYTSVGITHITSMSIVNADTASAHTINIYIKRSGSSSRRIIGRDLSLPVGADLQFPDAPTPGPKLSAGDVIEGDADVANKVDITISGGTE